MPIEQHAAHPSELADVPPRRARGALKLIAVFVAAALIGFCVILLLLPRTGPTPIAPLLDNGGATHQHSGG